MSFHVEYNVFPRAKEPSKVFAFCVYSGPGWGSRVRRVGLPSPEFVVSGLGFGEHGSGMVSGLRFGEHSSALGFRVWRMGRGI